MTPPRPPHSPAREALGALASGLADGRDGDPAALHADLCAAITAMTFGLVAEARGLRPPALTRLRDAPPAPGAWARLLDALAPLATHGFALAPPLARPGAVADDAAQQCLAALPRGGDLAHLGRVYEDLRGTALERTPGGALALARGAERRRSGAHYTPPALAAPVVAATLRPLVARAATPDDVLALRVCDPAMGAGAFLVEACLQLADALARAWEATGATGVVPPGVSPVAHARRLVAARCLAGVDRDPGAAHLARQALWLAAGAPELPADFAEATLLVGDALLGVDWPGAFPGAFARARPGFDAVVGNPPFLGGSRISTTHGDAYLAALLARHPGAHGNADLAAHFVRLAYDLLREGGALGFVVTNTVAQGDTRATGLAWVCAQGGTIYEARRDLAWPGDASVVVSVVHVARGPVDGPRVLDGHPVERITPFLASLGERAPARLPARAGTAFLGSKVYGQGFVFDDEDPRATPLAEMRRLVAADPRNAERIVPYLGGEELNASPTQSPRRFVIDFGDMSEAEARAWPDLMAVVEARVKPARERQRRARRARYWWRFGETVPGLRAAVRGLARVAVVARVGPHGAFALVPAQRVFSEQVVVFALDSYGAFALLQSRVHEAWARFTASSLRGDLRYTPSDCFETFPFPPSLAALDDVGQRYHARRAAVMEDRGEGLTKLYNRFHDPGERARDIVELRSLHGAMDRAVLDAYGWTDLSPACGFHPCADGRTRYAWDPGARDAVLARLLAMNHATAT